MTNMLVTVDKSTFLFPEPLESRVRGLVQPGPPGPQGPQGPTGNPGAQGPSGPAAWLNVRDAAYGAVGNGVTDDAPAINAAINAANNASAFGSLGVVVPYTSTGYATAGIVLKSGVWLRGERQVLLKRTGTSSSVYINATGQDNVVIENFTVDPNGLASSVGIRVSAGTTRMTIRNCKLIDSAQPANVHAIEVQNTASDVTIEDCWFEGLPNNIRLVAACSLVRIRRNRFTNWKERCIYVLGQTGACSSDVLIEHNRVTSLAAGGTIRQAITFQGTDNTVWHLRPKIRWNTVIGLDKSYNDPVTPGTADQISLHHCDMFEVTGNTSLYSGDTGLTVSVLSKRGVIAYNVLMYNDTCGMGLGATGTSISDITITGNVCMNNGQDRNGDRGFTAGLLLNGVTNIVTSGNILSDDQPTPTQDYGTKTRNCTNITWGVDQIRGNQIGKRLDDASPNNSTGIVDALSDRLVKVVHGSNANVARPDATLVYWVGTVQPVNALPDDLLMLKGS